MEVYDERTMELQDKILRGDKLSEREIMDVLWDSGFIVISEERHEKRRWTQPVSTVIELGNGDLYEIDWMEGLTEYQESEFYNQPYKVVPVEKTITVVEYVRAD